MADVFVPRFNAPDGNDPNWINTGYGGKNRCILSETSYAYNFPAGSVLPNCFTGDTKIITSIGTKPLIELVNMSINILTIGNIYRIATIQYFGIQSIWEVILSNGHSYKCTPNHRWVIYQDADTWSFVETSCLRIGDVLHTYDGNLCYIESVYDLRYQTDVYCPVEPVTHTCVLSGGEYTGQCTGYAWGRFMEILGSPPKLSLGDAGDWFGYTGDGYERGQEPRLGAVACWSLPGKPGHVAVVEQINGDGTIICSHSGWGWTPTSPVKPRPSPVITQTGKSPYWMEWIGYTFQGFIYNPATVGLKDRLSAFLEEAQKHINEGPEWTWKVSGLSRGQAWCAAFVVAVAETVGGILGVIMEKVYTAGGITKTSAAKGYGEWIEGPWYGKSAIPKPGDLVAFRYSPARNYTSSALSDHVGIVISVTGNQFTTVEGNTGNADNYSSKVSSPYYSITDGTIEGYFRPNWTKVGASSGNLITNNIGPLYEFTNTRKDALIRQIAYISASGEPSISQTRILLSAMNYTSLLNSLYEAGMPSMSGSGISNDAVLVEGLENNAQSVVKFIMAQGLNAAAGIGVAANIKHESGFRTDVVEYGYTLESGGGAGLCQWTNYPRTSPTGRRTDMINMAGPDWRNNMTGQLEYLWYELTNSYTLVLNVLRSVPNNVEGAMAAAEEFVRHFEVPTNMESNVVTRRNSAKEMWNQIVPVLTE